MQFQSAISKCPQCAPSPLAIESPALGPAPAAAPFAPPVLRSFPLLGHLPHFLWHGDLAEMLAAVAARHGPVAVARLPGGRPVFFVSDASLVREVPPGPRPPSGPHPLRAELRAGALRNRCSSGEIWRLVW